MSSSIFIVFFQKGNTIMLDLIQRHLPEIRQICAKFNVSRLELFGSAANGNFDEQTSDIDLLVEFKPIKQGRYADTYFGLLEAINNLFGRDVDLIMTRAIKNQYFLQKINQCRETLYAA